VRVYSRTVIKDERQARIARVPFEPATESTETIRRCNLCDASRFVELARVDRYGYPCGYHVCARCGLGFLSPRLTAAAYTRFYRDVYRPLVSAYHGRVIDSETVQIDQRGYADELVSYLRSAQIAAPRALLDVGGSTGVVAGAVADAFGGSVTVLDPSPDELARAAAAGMETIAGFVEDVDLAGRRFDLVLLCQTIDHLLDVAGTLAALRSALADDGLAFVDALDVEFMTERVGSIEGAVKIDHPYYLTRDTALAYFARAGLEVRRERLSGDGHWGFLLAPGAPREPDWAALARGFDRQLLRISTLRARRQ
jgi:SAM-dependent methyltransferase